MANHWQLSATYSFGALKDGDPVPYQFSLVDNGKRLARQKLNFAVAPDIGGEYGYATTDQRHRAVFNGIAEIGYGFQVSGVYFYGSGQRYSTSYGGDRRDAVDTSGATGRLRPDGTIVPRNLLVGSAIHRVDMRLQRRIPLGGNRSIDGMLEAFNLLNHTNYGSYTTQESNAAYGRPTFNNNIAYQPRSFQLGFRLAF
ncbi:MAG: hypothetical protein ABL971_14315 [Vicinamibacterales bacterium]